MSTSIHCHAERRCDEDKLKWEYMDELSPFSSIQSYFIFGWLAGVRNYSAVPPIAKIRGLPADVSKNVEDKYRDNVDAYCASWLSIKELLDFDYDAVVEDRRVTIQVAPNHWDGGGTCEPGKGEIGTYRQFFDPQFFEDLNVLQKAGAERIVFWFVC